MKLAWEKAGLDGKLSISVRILNKGSGIGGEVAGDGSTDIASGLFAIDS